MTFETIFCETEKRIILLWNKNSAALQNANLFQIKFYCKTTKSVCDCTSARND